MKIFKNQGGQLIRDPIVYFVAKTPVLIANAPLDKRPHCLTKQKHKM